MNPMLDQLSNDSDTTEKSIAGFKFTPKALLEEKRAQVANAFFALKQLTPVRHSKANFSDSSNQVGISCAISKRYRREHQPYWYGLHPQWLCFMRSVANGYFVLGCMDRNEAYAIPLDVIQSHLDELNKTEKESTYYWHIALSLY